MKIKLLEAPPLSGSVIEHWFAKPDGDTWFNFALDDGREWAGLFSDARLVPVKGFVEFVDRQTVLINVGGAGYVIDAPGAALLYMPDIVPLVEVLAVPERDFVVARNFTNLFVLGREAERWRSKRIASDGIQFRHSTPNTLHGRAWQYQKRHDFTLTYDGWKLSSGAELKALK